MVTYFIACLHHWPDNLLKTFFFYFVCVFNPSKKIVCKMIWIKQVRHYFMNHFCDSSMFWIHSWTHAMVWANDQYLLAGRGIHFENSFFASGWRLLHYWSGPLQMKSEILPNGMIQTDLICLLWQTWKSLEFLSVFVFFICRWGPTKFRTSMLSVSVAKKSQNG